MSSAIPMYSFVSHPLQYQRCDTFSVHSEAVQWKYLSNVLVPDLALNEPEQFKWDKLQLLLQSPRICDDGVGAIFSTRENTLGIHA